MHLPENILRQVLVKSGYITEDKFDEIAKSAEDLGKDIADTIIFKGYLDEREFGKLLSDYYGVGYVDLSSLHIPQEVINSIPEKLALTYKIIPFEKTDKVLKVAMADPKDFEALEFAKRHTGLQIEPYYVTAKALTKAYGKYKRDIKQDFENVIAEYLKKTKKDDDLAKAAERLPVIKIFDTILAYAVAEGTSDIHIETQEDNVVVRFRIDGVLRDIIKQPRGIEDALVARIKILSSLKIDEHRIPQDGRYKFTIND